jgi:hypothetical protein
MCCGKSIIKRVAPFFLTFAVGLFIASFFVTVAAPSFQFRRGFNRHREEDRQIRLENERLRQDNDRLTQRLNEIERRDWVLSPEIDVPPPPVAPTMPMKTVPYKAR